jgi:hypothetical protein
VAGEGGSQVKQPHLPLTKTLVNKLHCSQTACSCCGAVRGGRGACGLRRSPRKQFPVGQKILDLGQQEGLSPTETPRLRLDHLHHLAHLARPHLPLANPQQESSSQCLVPLLKSRFFQPCYKL